MLHVLSAPHQMLRVEEFVEAVDIMPGFDLPKVEKQGDKVRTITDIVLEGKVRACAPT